ncbi:polysaccharide pyruvyl transferase family protein [Sphingomonas sp.]|uniref:polysaccharide pyruvyl transferase family protein n=1 Tax=Sphingomonas sp. TaxID=28214 RepID=UPI002D80B43D|nr:polysaccharide pyruvyl transferase family protein [Sphingomonas sp.]HEU0044145.1 polysaccharide pyruvyl transferase family protein [Sphingomonas sp.]
MSAADRRRIGVLTFHRCFNYGSYWQARCLVEGLRSLGHDAELLDHDDEAVNRAEARCLMQPALPHRTARSDMPAMKAKARKFVAAIEALPLSPRFALDEWGASPTYDAVVVGSDEVWNFRHPWYGGKQLFFGRGLNAARRVSYAASFGNHDADEGVDEHWADMLRDFDHVSVRDANSHRMVTQARGVEPALVLDPCLQFQEVVVAGDPGEATPYAVIYGHGLPDWLAKAAQRWAGAAGVRLISIGYRNDWADEQRLDAGPAEFASLMAGAHAVVTNFFHGCVFALINGKPLVSAPSDYRSNKVRDLAAALGMQHRLVTAATPPERVGELLDTPLEPAIADRIAVMRKTSRAFLDAALA